MALNLGELYVQLSLQSKDFTKGLSAAVEKLDKFGKEVKKAGRDIAEAGALVSGFGAVMVAEAAKYDRVVAKSVTGLQQEYSKLAVEIGRTLAPVVDELAKGMAQVTRWFQGLAPETKQTIADFVRWAVAITAAGTAIAGLGVALEAFSVVAMAALSPIGLVAATIAAGFALAVVQIGALQNAMDGLGKGGGLAKGLKGLGGLFEMTPGLGGAGTVLSGVGGAMDIAGGTESKGAWEGIKEDFAKGAELITAELKTRFSGLFGDLGGPAKDASGGLKLLTDQSKELAERQKLEAELLKSTYEWEKAEAEKREELVKAIEAWQAAEDKMQRESWKAVGATVESQGPNATKTLYEPLRAQFDMIGATVEFFGGALAELAGAFAAGGIVGVIINLVQHSQTFADVAAVLTGVIESLANVLGAVLVPLAPLIASVMGLVDALAVGLQPAFDLIASILEPFIPIIVLVGEMFRVIAPALGMLLAAVMMIQNPTQILVSKAMPLFFELLKLVGGGLLRIVQFIAPVWNQIAAAVVGIVRGVIDAVISVVKSLGGDIWGKGIIGALESMKPHAKAMQINLYDVAKAIVDLEGLTWDAAMAKAKETAEVLKGTEAQRETTAQLRKLGEELTNVPEGFKVTAAQYGAIDAAGGLGGKYLEPTLPSNTGIVPPIGLPAAPGASSALEAALPSRAYEPPPIVVTVKLDSRELANSAAVVNENKAWQRTGERRRMEAF